MVAVVMGGEDVGEPPALLLDGRRDRAGIGGIDRGRELTVPVVDEHAIVVREAGELVNVKLRHGEILQLSLAFSSLCRTLTGEFSHSTDFGRNMLGNILSLR